MNSDAEFTDLKETLKDLKVNPNRNRWIGSGKAPHKPLLLLSVLMLNKHDMIDLRDIQTNDKKLLEIWDNLWKCLGYEKSGNIKMPFTHLQSDGNFWIDTGQAYSLSDDFILWLNEKEKTKEIVICLFSRKYFLDSQVNTLKNELKKIDDRLKSQ